MWRVGDGNIDFLFSRNTVDEKLANAQEELNFFLKTQRPRTGFKTKCGLE